MLVKMCLHRNRKACATIGLILTVVWMLTTSRCCSIGLSNARCKEPFTQYNLLSNRLSNRCRPIMYTSIQPVVKPVWQPVWQPAVSCKRGIRVVILEMTRQWRCYTTVQTTNICDLSNRVVSHRLFRTTVNVIHLLFAFFKCDLSCSCTADDFCTLP